LDLESAVPHPWHVFVFVPRVGYHSSQRINLSSRAKGAPNAVQFGGGEPRDLLLFSWISSPNTVRPDPTLARGADFRVTTNSAAALVKTLRPK
jgi:hypothetical protein